MKTKLNSLLVGGILLAAVLKAAGQPATNATFTKITTGAIVTDAAHSFGCGWGDYDGDGYLDLIVGNGLGDTNALYHNNGNGTFTRVTTGPIATTIGDSNGGVWADFDNDGDLDLFVDNWQLANFLFRNDGNGDFTRITNGSIVNDIANFGAAAWGDYDNDGFVDLFVPAQINQGDFLYHNRGDGTFERITNSVLVLPPEFLTGADGQGTAWGDYDNDGDLDLFIGSAFGTNDNSFFRNDGGGAFTRITNSVLLTDGRVTHGCDWGDYDNDGFLDLFVADNAEGTNHNYLYRNNGDGTFTSITNGSIVNEPHDSISAVWGDYDNDGFLDLFVSNRGANAGENNLLYRNNGDGTFAKIMTGSLVNDGGQSLACAWGDYDNDGFLDLFVGNGFDEPQRNFLYRNNGNSKSWIKLKLVGTLSNRAAIGAKVRMKATIGGKTFWQLREISGGSNFGSQNDLRANFGLGDATNVDLVRIEWPSGAVQELHNLAANQFLTAIEPPRLQAVGRQPDGSFQFQLTGGVAFRYALETSSDLTAWTPWTTVTNTSRTIRVTDPSATNAAGRFYRAVMP